MKVFLKGIDIKKDQVQDEVEISIDDALVEELKTIVTNSKAIALGFYYDEKNKLRLNTNKCISYLRKIAEFIIKHGSFNDI